MVWNDFYVIGDSISYGVRTNSNWVIEYCKLLWNKYNVIGRPFTFLKSGWTSGDFLKNIGKFLSEKKNEIFIQLGANDIRAGVKPYEFAWNVFLISRMSLARQTYIIEIPHPKGFGSNGYGQFDVETYNRAVRIFFDKAKDVHFIKTDGLDFVDGIHLSDVGNGELAKRVLKAVEGVRLWT